MFHFTNGNRQIRPASHQRPKQRRLAFELLEERYLLATVSGTVYVDHDGNLSSDPGEGVPGAAVFLHSDRGTNGFDLQEDPVIGFYRTNGQGGFVFDQLEAGNYWIRQPKQIVELSFDEAVLLSKSIFPVVIEEEIEDDVFAIDFWNPEAQPDDPPTATLMGTLFRDLDLDDSIDANEIVPGATIHLYKDDGNGEGETVFDTADIRVAVATTDAHGKYWFEVLEEGDYWLHQPEQVIDGRKLDALLAPMIHIDSEDFGVLATVIDSFDNTMQSVATFYPELSDSDSTNTQPGEAIGGERDIRVFYSSILYGLVSIEITQIGDLLFWNDDSLNPVWTVTWDGKDGNPDELSYGLEGVDLTKSAARFRLDLVAHTLAIPGSVEGQFAPFALLEMRLYSDADRWSTFSYDIPLVYNIQSYPETHSLIIDFNEFIGSADLTDIRAIELRLEGSGNLEGRIGSIETIGPAAITRDFQHEPEIDLEVTITVDNNQPPVGSDVKLSVEITNKGPDAATGVTVGAPAGELLVPPGLTIQSFQILQGESPFPGTFDPATGILSLGTELIPDSVVRLELVATIDTHEAMMSVAEVLTADQLDPNSTPGNGEPNEDDYDALEITPPWADISITDISDSDDPISVDKHLIYSIDLSSNGTVDPSGVVVTAHLPAGVVPRPDQSGLILGPDGVVSVLVEDFNELVTIVVRVESEAATDIVTAFRVSADTYDPNPKNNARDETTEVLHYGSISGTVWIDANNDGNRDPDETRLPGIVVYLDLDGNGRLDEGEPKIKTLADDLATSNWDEGGEYHFSEVKPGNYDVRIETKVGYGLVSPADGTHTVDVEAGQDESNVDFRMIPAGDPKGGISDVPDDPSEILDDPWDTPENPRLDLWAFYAPSSSLQLSLEPPGGRGVSRASNYVSFSNGTSLSASTNVAALPPVTDVDSTKLDAVLSPEVCTFESGERLDNKDLQEPGNLELQFAAFEIPADYARETHPDYLALFRRIGIPVIIVFGAGWWWYWRHKLNRPAPRQRLIVKPTGTTQCHVETVVDDIVDQPDTVLLTRDDPSNMTSGGTLEE